MPPFWIMISVLALAACAYVLGRARAIRSVDGNTRRLHSRPGYYGWNAALFTAVPALMVLVVWTLAQPLAVNQAVRGHLPADVMADAESRSLVLADVQRTARGLTAAVARGVLSAGEAAALGADDASAMDRLAAADIEIAKTPEVLAAARDYRRINTAAGRVLTGLALILALGGMAFALMRTTPQFRARNVVEQVVRGLLILCSLIAIATTVGIVLSLVFESIHFFRLYPWQDFFFGTE